MSHPIADAIGNAVGALRADKDMKAVLDQLGQLTDRHIEDLDPAAARLEPTPADAVKALLDSQGRASDPQSLVPGVTTRDISIAGPASPLSARVFTPAGPGPFPLELIDADLSGLPSVTLITADIDPLRSDGAQMEDALRKARVPVERRNFDGVTHEFFGMAAVVGKAREAQAWAGDRLLEAFAAA